ncbi:MAG: hypothetical protein ABR555_04805 [Pyrinomonadaceae bacterium]
MKSQSHLFTVALLLMSVPPTLLAQDPQTGAASQTVKVRSEQAITPEETIVRAAYEKLSALSKVDASVKRTKSATVGLRFELSDFKVGPITEILPLKHSELVTGASGNVILISHALSRTNYQEERVSYRAEWTNGQYASAYEPQWTMANVLAFYAGEYHDVGEYAAYQVTVFYQGKTKTYRAVALFHNAFHSQEDLKPSFWDTVVGMGGALTDLWNEKRRPAASTDPPQQQETLEPTIPANRMKAHPGVSYASATLDGSGGGEITTDRTVSTSSSDTFSTVTASTSIIRKTTEDSRNHITGQHGESVGFEGICSSLPGFEQLCQVGITDSFTYERGTLSNLFFIHVNRIDEKLETASGPLNTNISCSAARGVATSNCLFGDCVFSATLGGSGANVRMTGGDVWNGQVQHTHHCALPGGGTNCTTPGFDGSCPPGTTRDAFGNCCPSSTTPGTCSATFANKCFMYNGDYDFFTCTCYGCDWCGGSPVVLDLNNDGIALTDPAHGVEFDLNGNGTRDRLGWTTGNSDDAWLALDRDENGTIDNGAELFGDFTPQPPGPNKNGFFALAEFDRASNGGNGDGLIDNRDRVFSWLRLWQDANHNGISESSELHTLDSMNVKELEFAFKESKRTDEYGNEFRYRAKVKDTRDATIARWAWDVFLAH